MKTMETKRDHDIPWEIEGAALEAVLSSGESDEVESDEGRLVEGELVEGERVEDAA